MSTFGDIFEGEQMDCTYKWGRATLMKTAAGKTRREIWSSSKDTISSIHKVSHIETRTMPSRIIGSCFGLPPKRLNFPSYNREKLFEDGYFQIFVQTRFPRERRVALVSWSKSVSIKSEAPPTSSSGLLILLRPFVSTANYMNYGIVFITKWENVFLKLLSIATEK